jgi:hypothetical protein
MDILYFLHTINDIESRRQTVDDDADNEVSTPLSVHVYIFVL